MSDSSKKDSSRPAPRKAAKGAAAAAPAEHGAEDDSLAFETALERLELIVEELENGEIPLANLLARYEEATGLLKTCEQQLNQAQLRVEKLMRTKDGSQPQTEPFAAGDGDPD